jgi:hypothetical protein
MAEREAKSKKRTVKAAPPARLASGGSMATRAKSSEILSLETERDALQAELAAARARIAELERTREQALNRIDWVIDSLHSLADE